MFTRWQRSRTVCTLAASALIASAGVAGAPAGASTIAGYQEYVALGDSWSAATAFVPVPVTNHVPIDCAQQSYNYPKQVAAALGITNFRDATCGSATTAHMTQPQSLPLGGVNPPQFDRLTPTTDLVTIGIGGNDIGLAGAVTDCVALLPFNVDTRCRDALNRAVGRIPAAEQALVQAVAGIRQRSPNAQVFVVDYLAGVPIAGCWPVVPITNADMVHFHNALDALNRMVHRAAATAGANLVDTYSTSGGHDVCQNAFTRWVEGVIPLSLNGPGVVVPAHPNSAGAGAQSRYVLSTVRAVPLLVPTSTTSTTTDVTETTELTEITESASTTPATDPPPTDAPTTVAQTDPPPTEPTEPTEPEPTDPEPADTEPADTPPPDTGPTTTTEPAPSG